ASPRSAAAAAAVPANGPIGRSHSRSAALSLKLANALVNDRSAFPSEALISARSPRWRKGLIAGSLRQEPRSRRPCFPLERAPKRKRRGGASTGHPSLALEEFA